MADETITILLSQFNQMYKEIEELRAYKRNAEQQKEKTGHWIPYAEKDGKTVEWVCSSCRSIKSVTCDRTEYCPNCGARMVSE